MAGINSPTISGKGKTYIKCKIYWADGGTGYIKTTDELHKSPANPNGNVKIAPGEPVDLHPNTVNRLDSLGENIYHEAPEDPDKKRIDDVPMDFAKSTGQRRKRFIVQCL